jgi:hypothetical protein
VGCIVKIGRIKIVISGRAQITFLGEGISKFGLFVDQHGFSRLVSYPTQFLVVNLICSTHFL